jgi:hypothetical protein
MFKRGYVRIAGEHATAKGPREGAPAFSNPRSPHSTHSSHFEELGGPQPIAGSRPSGPI